MRIYRIILVTLLYVCTSTAEENNYLHAQQFSEQFLHTVYNSNQPNTTATSFNLLDNFYLQAHQQQQHQHIPHQQTIIVRDSSYWKVKYSAICIAVVWCLFKSHQSLSCVVGEKFSAKFFKTIFCSIYSSCYWLAKKIITDLFLMVQQIISLSISQETT